MPVKRIFCIDMDTFFVSVERVFDPSLRGKPVIVGAEPGERGVVLSCSYETRQYGVHAGMSSFQAGRLCPHAIFVRGHFDRYELFSREIRAVLEGYAPVVQQASIDEFFCDLTGTERLYGPILESAKRIKRMIVKRTQLPCTIGIASSKLVAKIASNMGKPDGILDVPPGGEEEFLKDLPVGEMPGIGDVMEEKLHEWGVKTLGEVASLPTPVLKSAFGRTGEAMKARARGISGGDVNPIGGPPKSIGHETTFGEDSEDPVMIESALYRIAEKIGRRLRRKQLVARTFTLKFRTSDFKTVTRAHTLAEPSDRDETIFNVTFELFHAEFDSTRKRVRLVGIRATNLAQNTGQLPLFGAKEELKSQLFYEGIDRIRSRHGFSAIVRGRNFRMKRAGA